MQFSKTEVVQLNKLKLADKKLAHKDESTYNKSSCINLSPECFDVNECFLVSFCSPTFI